jgi:hypothetical protein
LTGVVQRGIDVRITDDALEAAFVQDSVRSAQRGRHRYGFFWSLFCLAAFLASVPVVTLRKDVLGSANAMIRTGGWVCVLAYAAWLLATCVGALHRVYWANHCTLDVYCTRVRWLSTIGYCGCLVTCCGLPLVFEQAAAAPAHMAELGNSTMGGSRHALLLHLAGWIACVLNVSYSSFFCFGSSPRTQAAAVTLSWILGVTAAVVISPTGSSARDFLVLHTASCFGVMVAYVVLGKSLRQGFLYTSILVTEVQSEREQKAEARAVGEQAVCAWVCHEVLAFLTPCS